MSVTFYGTVTAYRENRDWNKAETDACFSRMECGDT